MKTIQFGNNIIVPARALLMTQRSVFTACCFRSQQHSLCKDILPVCLNELSFPSCITGASPTLIDCVLQIQSIAAHICLSISTAIGSNVEPIDSALTRWHLGPTNTIRFA